MNRFHAMITSWLPRIMDVQMNGVGGGGEDRTAAVQEPHH